MAHKWARWLHNPCRLARSPMLQNGGQNHRWPTSGASGYITPAVCGGHRCWGQKQKWPTGGQGGYITLPPVDPRCFRAGNKISSGPHWAWWLHNPCHLGGPRMLHSRGQNHKWPTSGPGGYITPTLWGGSPMLHSGGQNQNWPTSGPSGYITPAVWGIPDASERGTKSEMAHRWAGWLHNPCRLGVPMLHSRGQM